jgi:hypothetical protein
MKNIVYIVHSIDTEGPLYESIEATFERLWDIFHLKLEPSVDMLRRLQAGEVDLRGKEAAVQKVVAPHLLAYNDTWDKVDAMLGDAMSGSYRTQMRDSRGGGWVYNWFCVDHVDYQVNPRRRDMGYHNIYDHYRSVIRETGSPQDGMHFHFHPHGFRGEAHRCATHWWTSSNALSQAISRKVIDRQWFPTANRPGFHVTRPDSHWFLEQFLPFDYSNQAIVPKDADRDQFSGGGGRLGDWRRAPRDWTPYHPAADDYQVPGNCRRWIARCLNVGTRFRLIEERDVRQAFEEARAGKPVIVSFANHDFRDIRPDVETVRALLRSVTPDYPEVPFVFAEAIEAMRGALQLPVQPPCELELSLKTLSDRSHLLEVSSTTPTFGPQPWLALRTSAGTYHYDNFDIETPFQRWQYVFDEDTFPLHALSCVGVAANNAFGTATVCLLDAATGKVSRKVWNEPATSADRASGS